VLDTGLGFLERIAAQKAKARIKCGPTKHSET
jgi:hypothetical protein